MARLIRAAHHASEREAISAVRGSRTLATRLLLTDAMAEQSHACRYRLVWIVLTDDSKITSVRLIPELRFVFVRRPVNVIVNWIFYSPKTKATVEDRSAVLFIALAEARILMELRQDLVQRWYRMVALQML